MTALTPEDLAELERLVGTARQLPWEKGQFGHILPGAKGHFIRIGEAAGDQAALIVAAVNALPRLLAMIKEQGEAYDILRDRLGEVRTRAIQAAAERDRLRAALVRDVAALDRVEQLRTRMTEHAEPHVPGCEGQPDCAGCIYLDLVRALDGDNIGAADSIAEQQRVIRELSQERRDLNGGQR